MTAAMIYGAGAGALHAITGPDHVLSLGPVALRAPQGAVRVGLRWGVGHGLGTLVLSIPLLLLGRAVDLGAIAEAGERLAGFALLATAGWSWWSLRRAAATHGEETRSPGVVGFIHGVTGAGSLVLVLPVLVAGDHGRTLLFLLAFAVGSSAAMAGLTYALGLFGGRLGSRVTAWTQRVFLAGAIVLGTYWLA